MENKQVLDSFLAKLKEDLIAPEVEKIMAENFTAPPPDSLEPKNIWEQKIRKNLTDLLSGQAVIDKLVAGFDAIIQDLRANLTPSEVNKISEEWNHGVEARMKQMESKTAEVEKMINKLDKLTEKETQLVEKEFEANEPKNECLQQSLGISEDTLTRFYDAGNHYFNNQNYQKASDAFFVVTNLDQRRHNAWMALGLAEVHCDRIEQALVSFSMASITDINSPFPYLYSAECCLKDNRKDEAVIYLNLAKESVDASKLENKQELSDKIKKLQESAK